jgi:glycosyltransferase involved in cell wall biosynthesis
MVGEFGEVTGSTIHVVHNGGDPTGIRCDAHVRNATRSQLNWGGDDVLIGAVGFFRDWHGIDMLLHAFARQRRARPGTRLLLVGDGPAIPRLRRMAATLDLGSEVSFTGAVPHDRVPAYLAAMDVVVIPRAVEYASPLKLFEYMVAGKAIVAPRQPNLLEVLTDGTDALCFEPENLEELEHGLLRLIRDPGLRRRLGREAEETIHSRDFTWMGNAKRIVQTYEAIAGSDAQRSAA